MPFQAIPIAMNANPGQPLAKLAWLYMVWKAEIEEAPNGRGWFSAETTELERFCQASHADVVAAVEHLERCGLVERFWWVGWSDEAPKSELRADLNLPMTQIHESERKRFKASPDQLHLMASRQQFCCVTCGLEEHGGWHADHIIPRSKGGADTEENMQAICGPCNSRKGAKLHFVDFLGGR